MQIKRNRNRMWIGMCLTLTLLSLLLANAATARAQGLLYVLNQVSDGENQIYGFRVNETTGALTALAGFPLGTGGNGSFDVPVQLLAIDAANKRLYAINRGSNTISAYTINPATGALTALPFSPINLYADDFLTLAVHPSGSPLVVGGVESILSFQITATTVTAAAGSPYSTGSATSFSTAFSWDGNFVYTGGGFRSSATFAGFSVNAATGVLTTLPGSPFASGAKAPLAYATDNAGRLFMANANDNQVRVFTTVAGIPGAATGNPFTSGLFEGIHGVLHPNGFYMVTDRINAQVGVYHVSSSGAATTLAAIAGSPFAAVVDATPSILALNRSGAFLFVANAISFVGNSGSRNLTTFSVNPTTGALTTLGTQPADTLGTSGILAGMSYLYLSCAPNPIVTNGNDGGAGSLRQAIADACPGSTISFQAGITNVTLTTAELLIDKNLTISGGAGVTVTRQDGSPDFRIFNVAAGTVALNNLTISNGRLTGGNNGAGIVVAAGANLTCMACNMTGNFTDNAGGGFFNSGALTMNGCTIANNTASGSGGGGYLAASATFNDCIFTGNGNGQGGGLEVDGGTTTLTRCTFTGHSSTPGVIFVGDAGATVNATNCTVSGNSSQTAPIDIDEGTVNLLNSTLSNNSGGFGDSALVRNNATAVLTLKNSILSGSGRQIFVQSSGVTTSQGNNLLSDNSLPNPVPSDQLSTNPLLAPLSNYGGTTQTHALLPGSPALNAGASSGAPATDQRGITRDSNVDSGAFESRGFMLSTVSGNNQNASLGSPFPFPLVVGVTANGAGEPVAGGRITFTAPASGASANLASNTVMINASGQVSNSATANLFSGSYQVAASTSGGNTANFNLSNFCVSAAPVVTNKNDSGAGSLRQALADACVGAIITFAPNVTGTITLTSGQLLITRPLTVQGPGAPVLTISGNQQSRVFQIVPHAGNVTIAGLTIANGYVRGADVSGTGSVEAESVFGGGIDNLSTGTVNVSNCVLTGNRVQGGNATGTSDRVVAGWGLGGGLAHHNGGTLNLSGCLFTNNRAASGTASGGSTNLSFPAPGGGVFSGLSSSTSLNINQSTFTGNFASEGGGIAGSGEALTITNSTINGNEAPQGGGIYATSNTVKLINTTISGNRAVIDTGFGVSGLGGGIWLRGFDETLINCTITDNHSGDEGGGFFGGTNPPTKLQNTLIAGNTSAIARCPDMKEPVNSLGHNLIGTNGRSGAFNCVQNMTHGVNGDQLGTSTVPIEARLGPLADNGGPTQTHRLLPDSPALNAGKNSGAPTTDQRGVARPQNGAVDIGAVEANYVLAATGGTPQSTPLNTPFATPLLARLTENGLPFANVPLTFSAPNSGASATFPNGALVNTNAQGQASVNAVANQAQGSYAVLAAVAGLTPAAFALTNVCPTITLAPLPQATAGAPFNATLSASPAGGNYQFSSSNKPAWLSLTSNGNLSGTPPAMGSYTFNVVVTGFGICTQTFAVTLTVVCPALTLTPTTLPNSVQGMAYNQTLATLPAGGNYSYAVTTNVLPPGLTLTNNGSLSGTPTAAGNYAFAITVTGWGACTRTQNYNLLVTGTCGTVSVSPATLSGATVGTAYDQSFSAAGGNAPYTFAITQGALPLGLTLDANTGKLSGTPTQGGSFSFRLTATGLGGCSSSRNYVLAVSCGTLTFTPNVLPNGIRGMAYSQPLSVGPTNQATFSLLLGSLPPGFSLTSAGLLSGVTNQIGTYNFTVKALAGTCQSTKAYSLVMGNGAAAALAQLGDYDGDGKADFALWSNKGIWRLALSTDGANHSAQTQSWGQTGDVPLLGDYDGDSKTDCAVFRRADGTWNVKRSSDGSALIKAWGLATDVPVPGDYDGDGRTDIAVWRPSEGTWYVLRSSDGQYEVTAWGVGYAPYHDVAVPGDYDGDGKTDLAVFRQSIGTWLIKRSSDSQFSIKQWGIGIDVPVAADYDGDGKTDFAIWRDGTWYIWQSASNSARVTEWGTNAAPYNDQAVPGDYDGDGQVDIAVWRTADQTWYIRSSSGTSVQTRPLGQMGDAPVSSRPR